MNKALISLGSNLGDSIATLKSALALLKNTSGIKIDKISSFYKTPPVGGVIQDDFINACALLDVAFNAHDLMQTLLNIEKEFKRERIIRWGPRTLDLDLIDFNGEISNDSFITLPHPRAYQRAFVLVPANEIAPDLLLGGKYSIQHYLKNLSENDIKGITKLNYAQ
ncbi:2-amino-4-hydroxy-6-hydroxymethyldihydropteridine diphosphokinase [Succinatimonas hippei]|uniref:2-amino-4-hydroxy-6- hydroxymethyldihydropteridine diphosphokinase n=1 Tax=Succinatimonas hippei TaxID=626938 RepID=UPI0023F69901|nr:2-amino-4-hydroxy-6-hydroxymethyldihydropteridine diphosphokinase [Succinatimonas hippei]MDM8120574.1 2-amino-4-hydroxy-6-hydroxymethyldihydropteridine diphosphokinase [Succinatimonas hippei]